MAESAVWIAPAEAVLWGQSAAVISYGSVFDGELIFAVKVYRCGWYHFYPAARTYGAPSTVTVTKTRIVHKGFVSYEEEGRCQKEAHNEVKVVFFIMACQEIRTTGSSEVNIFCKSGVIIRVLSFLNRII